MNTVMHEYWRNNKKAVVRLTDEGFEVDLIKDESLLETRKVHDHSESYAEDVAENWVDGIISEDTLNPNSVGYYGYNEKTDNYFPELDD